MNVERIRQLADIIEKTPHRDAASPFAGPRKTLDGFSMAVWHCGTVGCIAGWATFMFNKDSDKLPYHSGMEALGLDWNTASELFYAYDYEGTEDEIQPTHASAVLRHLADTGEVDWSVRP